MYAVGPESSDRLEGHRFRPMAWQLSPTAGRVGTIGDRVRIRHPFHPMNGEEIQAVSRRPHWGVDRVMYLTADGRLRSISAAFTDIDQEDEFRRVAAGRAAFRTCDLTSLCRLIEEFQAAERVRNV